MRLGLLLVVLLLLGALAVLPVIIGYTFPFLTAVLPVVGATGSGPSEPEATRYRHSGSHSGCFVAHTLAPYHWH